MDLFILFVCAFLRCKRQSRNFLFTGKYQKLTIIIYLNFVSFIIIAFNFNEIKLLNFFVEIGILCPV